MIVFVVLFAIGLVLELVGRVTHAAPTVGDITRALHRYQFGGWLLFAMWAVVGWHLLAS